MATAELNPVVQAWLTKHSDPMYVTDLWFVVKEGENEIRIPACSAVLRLTCSLVRDLPEAAGDVPVLGDHTASAVVDVLGACYPFFDNQYVRSRGQFERKRWPLEDREVNQLFRYFVIYHKRLGESQRMYEARRRKGYEYDSDEQEFISGIDEHLTRATDDLHKVTEYLLTNPSQ